MTTLAQAFANSCQEAAGWREQKASDDEDMASLHCAEALRTAASWALSAGEAGDRLQRLLGDVGQTEEGMLLLGHEAQRILASYCSEGPEDLERWLLRVADAQYDSAYDYQHDQMTGDGT